MAAIAVVVGLGVLGLVQVGVGVPGGQSAGLSAVALESFKDPDAAMDALAAGRCAPSVDR